MIVWRASVSLALGVILFCLASLLGRPVCVPAAPVTPIGVHLPPCDDDAPGKPVTGPCWLSDDGRVAVWPYPYAPQPWYVLDGSQP